MAEILRLVILPFVKRHWKELVLVLVVAITISSVRAWLSKRDELLTERVARIALYKRDSAQVAALRDSLSVSRKDYDSTATALRSALLAYAKAGSTALPTVNRPSLAQIRVTDIQPATVIELCKEFFTSADAYKHYADSTIEAQARIINNAPQKVVQKSSRNAKLVAFLSGAVVTAVVLSHN